MTDQAGPNPNQASESKDLPATGQTVSTADQGADQGAAGRAGSSPYGMYVALATLFLLTVVVLFAMVVFQDLFENATEVSTMLGSLFAVVGTVVGAYFGIKTSGDTRDKMQGTIERSNEIANRALAELDPETSRR